MTLRKFYKPLVVVFLFLIAFFGVSYALDNDFWFIINHGRYLVSNWPNGFINYEPFTILEGLSFSFEKWATSILFYLTYTRFGLEGIHLLVTLVMTLFNIFIYKTCVLVSKNRRMSLLICTILLFVFSIAYGKTRPQIFSFLFLAVEIYQLEKYTRDKNHKHLLILPALSVLFMQFHSTMWVMFIIFMLPYLFDFKFLKINHLSISTYSKIPLLIVLILSVLVALINPYGYHSLLYLFNSNVKELSTIISELQKLTIEDWTLFIFSLTPMFVWLFLKHEEDLPLRYVYFLCGTFLMSLIAVRNTAYFNIAAIFILAWMYKDVRLDFKINKNVFLGVLLGLILSTPLLVYNISQELNNTEPVSKEYDKTYAVKPLDYLAGVVESDKTRLYTSFNDGSYAQWLGFKTYIDPRAEVFVKEINQKEDIFAEWLAFHHGFTSYKTLQNKYHFDYWLVPKVSTYYKDLKESSYEEIYRDDEYVIYRSEECAK